MPVCFGISFTKTPMNQARSLVHVYTDGSVAISTGAVEMGQGVNTKLAQVAERIFSLPIDRIKVHTTNTLRIANTSPTAASAAADLNGRATQIACETILERLKIVAREMLNDGACKVSTSDGNRLQNAAKMPAEAWTQNEENEISFENGFVFHHGEPTTLDWVLLINEAFMQRVNLSEHAHYATQGISFDWSIAKGKPFAYHVYGTAIVGVTVDCRRGIYEVDYVKCCHDFGNSMNTQVDFGQIEGGIVQGLGWMTMEEIFYDSDGKLRSNALSTYKIPDIYSVPKEIEILPLETARENPAIFNSKAVGEPPLMYGIGAYFAIREAVKAFNPKDFIKFNAPFTPEKVLMSLYNEDVKTMKAK